MSTDLAPIPQQSTAISVDAVLDRLSTIQELMRRAMVLGVDYGQIPGTSSKPTLLKPGAEKLCLLFRFSAEYKTHKHFDDGHLTVESTCRILDRDGVFLGESSAICSTRESKYAFRTGERKCPVCGKSTIIKGKAEYGGGWLCWKKKGGCGQPFRESDERIVNQQVGKTPNENLADSYNTVVRIAEKRAFIASVRLVTGSSALFDEEQPHIESAEIPEERTGNRETTKEYAAHEPTKQEEYDAINAKIDNYCTVTLTDELSLKEFNERVMPWVKSLPEAAIRVGVWERVIAHAAKGGLIFDDKEKKFKVQEDEKVGAS